MLLEVMGGPPGMPPFAHYILQRIWQIMEYTPCQTLDWLASQVVRHKLARNWTIQKLEVWVELYLLAHNNIRVRNGGLQAIDAAMLFGRFLCIPAN